MSKLTSGNKNQGSNWARKSKRLAIYLRDNMQCLWCGRSVEDGIRLTLDHYRTRTEGGSNDPANLFTTCIQCNSQRRTMPVWQFAIIRSNQSATLFEGGPRPSEIVTKIKLACRRSIKRHRERAKAMIASRGWSAIFHDPENSRQKVGLNIHSQKSKGIS